MVALIGRPTVAVIKKWPANTHAMETEGRINLAVL